MLNINRTMENGTALFTLEGRLDTVTAPELEAELKALPGDTAGLTLDLGKLEYISSAGLRVLLSAQKAMSGRDGMRLIHVTEAVMEVFEITGFSDILNIE